MGIQNFEFLLIAEGSTMIKINYRGRKKDYAFDRLKETCFQCSVCSLHCVVQELERFDAKHTFVYDLFGFDEPQRHPALWTCSGCHKCHTVCPQDVNPARVIENLREQSFEEGTAPDYVYDQVDLMLETGMSFPVTKKTVKDREKLGLTALTKGPVEEIRKIFEKTGLLKKIEKGRSGS